MSGLELLSRGACMQAAARGLERRVIYAHRFACGRLLEIQIEISGVGSSTTRSSSFVHSLYELFMSPSARSSLLTPRLRSAEVTLLSARVASAARCGEGPSGFRFARLCLPGVKPMGGYTWRAPPSNARRHPLQFIFGQLCTIRVHLKSPHSTCTLRVGSNRLLKSRGSPSYAWHPPEPLTSPKLFRESCRRRTLTKAASRKSPRLW